MSIEVCASTNDAAWQEFVRAHAEGRIEHDLAWREVFTKTYRYQPRYLVASDGTGLLGVFPLFSAPLWRGGRCLVSLPFLDCGGPLASSPEARASLLAEAGRQAAVDRAAYLEVRALTPSTNGAAMQTHKAKLVLDLAGDTETVWRGLDAKVRNQVRKAQKQGLVARVDSGESLDAFYRVYGRNMRDLGSPVAARGLFTRTFEAFGSRAKLISVWLGERAIAGAVWLRFGPTAYVPWASSLRPYFALSPNNLLYWEAISLACETGCREFDFGRSTIDSGPYRFKAQWGARPRQLYWQYYGREDRAAPADPAERRSLRFAASLWRRLPVCAANLLGPRIVARMP